MIKKQAAYFFGWIFFLIPLSGIAQVTLNANGPGNTYELINSVLAPGYNVVEAPDASHTAFGRHITEVFDAVLNKYVFEFNIHTATDNDPSTGSPDRQRNEIKTYDQSPANLIGTIGETITYKWRFKIPTGFQPSPNFTHLHQIKAVGGDDDDPVFTITARKGSTPALNASQLIYNLNSTDGASTFLTAPLSSFENTWVEGTEIVTVGAAGKYSIRLKRVSDGATLLAYNNSNIVTIRPDNSFIRPKWGIYRSLLSAPDLRDEAVRFSDFSIAEGPAAILPINYYWIGGTGPAIIHGTAANWNVSLDGKGSGRSIQAADDVLIFDGSNIAGAANATGIVNAIANSASFGGLILQNNADVILQRSGAGSGTVTINGDGTPADDFRIDAGSSLKITAAITNGGMTLVLGSAAIPCRGSIAGKLAMEDNNAFIVRLLCKAPNTLNFISGGKCVVKNTVTDDYPFGIISTSVSGGINFKSGSELIYRGGVNPYSSSTYIPFIFEKGSNFVFEAANVADMFTAHVLANVIIRNNSIVSAENFYNIDTLRVNAGASFYIKGTGTSPVSGDIVNDGTFGAAPGYTSANLILEGALPQIISGTGIFNDIGAITVASNAAVMLNVNLPISGSAESFIMGTLNTQTNSLTGAGKVTLKPALSAAANATLTSGSNIISLDPAVFSTTVNTANVYPGVSVSGTGIPASTVIIAGNPGSNSIIISATATQSGSPLGTAITISNHAPTLITANSGGSDGSITVTGTRIFGTGTNYIFNAPSTSPFSLSSDNPTGNVIVNASVTTNKSQTIGGLLTVNSGTFTVRSFDAVLLIPL